MRNLEGAGGTNQNQALKKLEVVQEEKKAQPSVDADKLKVFK